MPSTQTHQNPACPACACKLTVKKGVRRNRLQALQVFRCTECLHRFTGARQCGDLSNPPSGQNQSEPRSIRPWLSRYLNGIDELTGVVLLAPVSDNRIFAGYGARPPL